MLIKDTHSNKPLFRVLLTAAAVLILCGVFCGASVAAENGANVKLETGDGGVQYFATLKEAVDASTATVSGTADTITILVNITSEGISVPTGKNIVIDLNGKTVTFEKNPSGDPYPENKCLIFFPDSTIVLKNGTIRANPAQGVTFRFVIQNFANLTLTDVTIDGTKLNADDEDSYVVSNNNGAVLLNGSTSVVARAGKIAIDCCWLADDENSQGGTQVTIDTSGTITGIVEYGLDSYERKTPVTSTLTINNGKFNGSFSVTDIVGNYLESDYTNNIIVNGGTFSDSSFFPYMKEPTTVQTQTTAADRPPIYSYTGGTETTNSLADAFEKVADEGTITVVTGGTEANQVTLSGRKSVTLDLNGQTISAGGGTFPDGLIRCSLGGNNKLIIKDSKTGGTLDAVSKCRDLCISTGSSVELQSGTLTNGGVYVRAGGTFTMSGGSITNSSSGWGGGVYVSLAGTFTMTGGTISGNNATIGDGGGVFVSRGTFTMSGGSIEGNIANRGAGVYVYNWSTFTLSGGSIEGNTARDCGGGVDIDNSTFVMSGGTISGNSAPEGGAGVYVAYGTFRLSGGSITENNAGGNGGGLYMKSGTLNLEGGTPVISNNTGNSAADNVYLTGIKQLCLTGKLVDGADIRITKVGDSAPAKDTAFGKVRANAGGADYIRSDDLSLSGKIGRSFLIWGNLEGDQLTDSSALKIGDKSYSSLEEAIAAAETGEVITLLKDITSGPVTVDEGKKFTLDFNNHTLTFKKPNAEGTETRTSGFNLSANADLVFKNGTIRIAEGNEALVDNPELFGGDKPIKRLIQNYANLTLENMVLDAEHINHQDNDYSKTELKRMIVLSINCGTVELKGNTSIYVPEIPGIEDAAFDVYDMVYDNSYPTEPRVTVNTTGTIEGKIKYALTQTDASKKGFLKIENGTFPNGIEIADGSDASAAENLQVTGGRFPDGYNPGAYVPATHVWNQKTGEVTVIKTPSANTPAPFVGILAGLGTAVVVAVRMRR